MTERHTFEIELVTSDEVDDRRARKIVAQFLNRLMKTDAFVSTKLTAVDTTVQQDLSENEKNRLIKALDELSSEECVVAVEIAEDLSETNE